MKGSDYKKALRRQLKLARKEIPPQQRQQLSRRIAERFLAGRQYKDCDALLCFVSTDIEVDTTVILEQAFADGKQVAVPRCISGTREMEFCIIGSLSELVSGAYGIPEPPKGCEVTKGSERTVCVVPALAYDREGYRLGFGGGYYDRFLPDFKGISCGIIYESFLLERLPREDCDAAVNMIITEERTTDL